MSKTITPNQLQEDLRRFSGSESYHAAGVLFRGSVMSDGIKYLSEAAGAGWLVDAILSHHRTNRKLRVRDERYFWTLKLNKTGSGAKLFCTDGGKDGNKAVRLAVQAIPYTDFPLTEIQIYAGPRYNHDGNQVGWIIYLPSEH